jgi:hypothetical protein
VVREQSKPKNPFKREQGNKGQEHCTSHDAWESVPFFIYKKEKQSPPVPRITVIFLCCLLLGLPWWKNIGKPMWANLLIVAFSQEESCQLSKHWALQNLLYSNW